MRAIQSASPRQARIVDIPKPKLIANSILVRPHYVGNNPCDWIVTEIEPFFTQDQILGCDYSGVVGEIGAEVHTSLKPGDKVCGVVAAGVGCDVTRGAFAELIPAYGDFCFSIPRGITEPEAATLGVGISTIGVSFYQNFGIPMPDDDPGFGRGKPFFVYGGSSATGLWAIQFAKLSSFHVITTCSAQNFDLVKSRGADEVYDYHDFEKCVKDVKASAGDKLEYAYTCIGGEKPAKMCAEVLSSKGGKFVTIMADMCPRKDVESKMTSAQCIMADPHKSFMGPMSRTTENHELGLKVWKLALKYLEEGKIQPPPLDLRKGLEGSLQGMEDLRKHTISGKKIVSQLV